MPGWLISTLSNDLFIQLAIFVFATVILPRLYSFLKLNNDDKRRQYLETAISGAIRAGINAYAKQQGKTPFAILLAVANDHTVREAITGFAAGYLQDSAPTAITKLKVGGRIEDIVTSRLDNVVESMADTLARTAGSLKDGVESPIPIEKTNTTFGSLGVEPPADPVVPLPADEDQGVLELTADHEQSANAGFGDELRALLSKYKMSV